jgi:hypothetical protein
LYLISLAKEEEKIGQVCFADLPLSEETLRFVEHLSPPARVAALVDVMVGDGHGGVDRGIDLAWQQLDSRAPRFARAKITTGGSLRLNGPEPPELAGAARFDKITVLDAMPIG